MPEDGVQSDTCHARLREVGRACGGREYPLLLQDAEGKNGRALFQQWIPLPTHFPEF